MYFVENGLIYDAQLHAHSNNQKKNMRKKTKAKNGTGMIILQFYTSNNCPDFFSKDMFC